MTMPSPCTALLHSSMRVFLGDFLQTSSIVFRILDISTMPHMRRGRKRASSRNNCLKNPDCMIVYSPLSLPYTSNVKKPPHACIPSVWLMFGLSEDDPLKVVRSYRSGVRN